MLKIKSIDYNNLQITCNNGVIYPLLFDLDIKIEEFNKILENIQLNYHKFYEI